MSNEWHDSSIYMINCCTYTFQFTYEPWTSTIHGEHFFSDYSIRYGW